MATPFSHAIAALGIGSYFYRPQIPKRVWVAGMLCSAIPDLDAIGFRFGIRYGDFWGHRGFTHSLVFAALLAGLTVFVCFRKGVAGLDKFPLLLYLFLATASHGLLDAMTSGGLGVAFFSPFDNRRYFLPWRPIRVSPIGISRFAGPRAAAILRSEFLWIWIPTLLLVSATTVLRHIRSSREEKVQP